MMTLGGPSPVASLYPSLDEYMGMNLQSDEVRQNLAVIPSQPYQVPAVVTQRPSQITGGLDIFPHYELSLFQAAI